MDIFLLFLQMNVEGSVPLKQILIFNRKKNFLKFPQNQFDISIFVITKCDRIYTNLTNCFIDLVGRLLPYHIVGASHLRAAVSSPTQKLVFHRKQYLLLAIGIQIV